MEQSNTITAIIEEPKTQEEIFFSSLISENEKQQINELKEISYRTCPYLRNISDFYYCNVRHPNNIKNESLRQNSIKHEHADIHDLTLYCMMCFECCYKYKGYY